MSRSARTGLTPFAEVSPRAVTGTRPVTLPVSPDLYQRMEARATADRSDLQEWLLRAVISELLRPEAEVEAERRARVAIATIPFSPSARPTNERKPHASYP